MPKDDKVQEKVVEKMETKVSIDDLVKNIEVEIAHAHTTNVPMPEIRQKVHTLIRSYGMDLSPESKKQFGEKLRERAEHMRRFYEAIYTEVVHASSQQGW